VSLEHFPDEFSNIAYETTYKLSGYDRSSDQSYDYAIYYNVLDPTEHAPHSLKNSLSLTWPTIEIFSLSDIQDAIPVTSFAESRILLVINSNDSLRFQLENFLTESLELSPVLSDFNETIVKSICALQHVLAIYEQASSSFQLSIANISTPNSSTTILFASISAILRSLHAEYLNISAVNILSNQASIDELWLDLINETGYNFDSSDVFYEDRRRKCRVTQYISPYSRFPEENEPFKGNGSILLLGAGSEITKYCLDNDSILLDRHIILVGRSQLIDANYSLFDNLLTKEQIRKRVLELQEYAHLHYDIKALNEYSQLLYSSVRAYRSIKYYQDHGATTTYIACDLSDPLALHDFRSQLSQYEIGHVIHSAGQIEDCLFRRKEPTSVHRVLESKINVLISTLRCISLDNLKTLTLFCSVAGVYGNRGQADYSAANEAISSIASSVNTRYPHIKVSVLNWGPWKDGGMASDDVNRIFLAKGVCPIGKQEGRKLFMDVLCSSKIFNNIIAGSAPWHQLEMIFNSSLAVQTSNIRSLNPRQDISISVRSDTDISAGYDSDQFLFTITPAIHNFMRHHKIRDSYVLPFAFSLEIFLEFYSSSIGFSSSPLVITDLKLLQGIILRDMNSCVVRLSGKRSVVNDVPSFENVYMADQSERQLYSCNLISATSERPSYDLSFVDSLSTMSSARNLNPAEIYSNFLFHGPIFQLIQGTVFCHKNWITAKAITSAKHQSFSCYRHNNWFLDPCLVDVIPQLAYLWSCTTFGYGALPVAVAKTMILNPITPLSGNYQLFLHFKDNIQGLIKYDALIISPDGEVVVSFVDFVSVSSNSLVDVNDCWRHDHESQELTWS